MNSSADLLKELRIDRRPGLQPKRRRWPWLLGGAAVLLGVMVVFVGGSPVEVETAVARSAAEGGPTSMLDASAMSPRGASPRCPRRSPARSRTCLSKKASPSARARCWRRWIPPMPTRRRSWRTRNWSKSDSKSGSALKSISNAFTKLFGKLGTTVMVLLGILITAIISFLGIKYRELIKKMFNELQKLMEQMDKNQIQQKLEEMKLTNKDIEKELDRALETFKRFEVEQKLQQSIEKHDELIKKEEKLNYAQALKEFLESKRK